MSRSSKGFADFFPTAPSVLQQKRSKTSQARKRLHSPSHADSHPSHASSAPPASPIGECDGGIVANGVPNGDTNTMPTSIVHEENDSALGDLSHEVGSASSTSTTSSVFSTGHPGTNMANHNEPHKSTSLTPLTNIDSSPRANGMSSPPKRLLLENHMSVNQPRSPLKENMTEASPSNSVDSVFLKLPNRPNARPAKGVVKGYRAIYDPDLDKTLKSKEKRSRQVQYQPFGEEVRLTAISHLHSFYT